MSYRIVNGVLLLGALGTIYMIISSLLGWGGIEPFWMIVGEIGFLIVAVAIEGVNIIHKLPATTTFNKRVRYLGGLAILLMVCYLLSFMSPLLIFLPIITVMGVGISLPTPGKIELHIKIYTLSVVFFPILSLFSISVFSGMNLDLINDISDLIIIIGLSILLEFVLVILGIGKIEEYTTTQSRNADEDLLYQDN